MAESPDALGPITEEELQRVELWIRERSTRYVYSLAEAAPRLLAALRTAQQERDEAKGYATALQNQLAAVQQAKREAQRQRDEIQKAVDKLLSPMSDAEYHDRAPGGWMSEALELEAQLTAALAAKDQAERQLKARDWQPITAAPRDSNAYAWWIVPKTADETYTDTSGHPILSAVGSYRAIGKYGCWSSLHKAIYWAALPSDPTPTQQEKP